MVTKGERRLGRTIRKLSNSVELSAKESSAKASERKFKEKSRTLRESGEDSPVQSLRDPFSHKKGSKEQP